MIEDTKPETRPERLSLGEKRSAFRGPVLFQPLRLSSFLRKKYFQTLLKVWLGENDSPFKTRVELG